MFSFFCIAEAEKEDFQANLTEQIKGTNVTKDGLWKKENTIGHGTEAIPTENTRQHTAVQLTAKFPRAVWFDTRPTQAYERIQITKASAVRTTDHFVSRNVQNSLTSTRENPSAMRTGTEYKDPFRSNHEKIVLFSPQAALESVMNDTPKPQVHLSADTVMKAPHLLHAQHDNKNQRSTNPASADGGLGDPIFVPRHHIIDKAPLRHDNDEKRSPSKGITNLGRTVYLSSTTKSIFQREPTEDSVRGNTTDPCFNCLKDGLTESVEKSAALPALSTHSSSESVGTKEVILDLNKFSTSLHNLHHMSDDKGKDIASEGHSDKIIDPFATTGEMGTPVYNQTFPPVASNKTADDSVLSNSHIKSSYSDTETVAEMSLITQQNKNKQSSYTYSTESLVRKTQNSATTTLYPSSKLFYSVGEPVKNEKQEVFTKKVSTEDPQFKLIYLDIVRRPVSYMPHTVKTPYSYQKSVLSEGSDHSAASLKPARMSPTAAYSEIKDTILDGPTASADKNPEFHLLTGRTDPINSILRTQMSSKPTSHTKIPLSTLLETFSTVTTKKDLTKEEKCTTSSTDHIILKKTFDDPSRTESKPLMKRPQTSTSDTRSTYVSTDSRRDSGDDMSVLTQTAPSAIPFPEKPTGSQVSDVRSDKHLSKIHQPYSLITESQNSHSLKLGDKNEQLLSAFTENGDKHTHKIGDKQRQNIQSTEEILKLQDEEEFVENQTLENKAEELLRLPQIESEKLEDVITSVTEMNQNTEAEKMEEHTAKISREEHVTLTQDKDLTQAGVSGEDTEREGMTKMSTFTQNVAEKQKQSLEEAESKEPSSREDIKDNNIREEEMTNVPLKPTTNSKELNRDKGHTVSSQSSVHILIKEFITTKQKETDQDENVSQIQETQSESFSNKVTSNRQPPHSALRSQRPKQSEMASTPRETYMRIKLHLSTHRAMLQNYGATTPLSAAGCRNKQLKMSASAIPTTHTSGDSTSKVGDALKPTSSPNRGSTKSAYFVPHRTSNKLSFTTPPLATTAGFQRAQSHFTVNSSPSLSIIYGITDHRHRLSASLSRANSVLHTVHDREQAEYIKPSMTRAPRQQMYDDSSTKPPTVAHISIGNSQLHQGQSAVQRSQSPSCSDMVSGRPCSFKLSEQTSHAHASHSTVDDNKQRFVQTIMPLMSQRAEYDQFPFSSVSSGPNLKTFGGGDLPVTYRSPGITGSASEKEKLQAKSAAEYENSRSGHAELLLVASEETNQTGENDSKSLISTTAGRRENHSNKTVEVLFTSIIQTENESKLNELFANNTFTYTTKKDFVNAKDAVALALPGSNNQTGTTAYISPESDFKKPKIQENHVTNMGTADIKPHGENINEKQNKASPLQQTASDNTLLVSHISTSSHPTVRRKSTQITDKIMNVTPHFQIITTKTSNILPPTSNTSGCTSKSLLATEKPSQTALQRIVQSNSLAEPLSLRRPPPTPSSDKLTPAVKRKNREETQIEEEHQISVKTTEQSQHTLPAITAISHSKNETEVGIMAGFSRTIHRDDQTSAVTEKMNFSSSEDIKSTTAAKTAVEAKHPLRESTSGAHTQEKKLKSQTIFTRSPAEIINELTYEAVGSSKSETIKTTTVVSVTDHTKKMHKTDSNMPQRDVFLNTADPKLQNNSCSSDCAVAGNATLQATHLKVVLSALTSNSTHDLVSIGDTVSDKSVHLERHRTPQWGLFVKKTTQRYFQREISGVNKAAATKATRLTDEATTLQTTMKSNEQKAHEKNTTAQLVRGAAKARMFEVERVSRSWHTQAKEEAAGPESGSRLLLSEPESESVLPRMNKRGRTSHHLYLAG